MMKHLLIFLFVVGPSVGNSQSLSSRALLNNLEPSWVFIEELRSNLEKETGNTFKSSIEQGYDFIGFELKDSTNQLFLQIHCKIKHPGELVLEKLYCVDKNLSNKLKKETKEITGPFQWDSLPKKTFKLNQEVIKYLEIADRIAAFGNDLSARPTDYRSVTITKNEIKLDQSNHMNSRSLDHKDSYLLRDLIFLIPLENRNKKGSDKIVIGSYFIGDMEIIFNDGSAKSQKYTGDKISKQLELEIKHFNKER
jgi:hypothetical protein